MAVHGKYKENGVEPRSYALRKSTIRLREGYSIAYRLRTRKEAPKNQIPTICLRSSLKKKTAKTVPKSAESSAPGGFMKRTRKRTTPNYPIAKACPNKRQKRSGKEGRIFDAVGVAPLEDCSSEEDCNVSLGQIRNDRASRPFKTLNMDDQMMDKLYLGESHKKRSLRSRVPPSSHGCSSETSDTSKITPGISHRFLGVGVPATSPTPVGFNDTDHRAVDDEEVCSGAQVDLFSTSEVLEGDSISDVESDVISSPHDEDRVPSFSADQDECESSRRSLRSADRENADVSIGTVTNRTRSPIASVSRPDDAESSYETDSQRLFRLQMYLYCYVRDLPPLKSVTPSHRTPLLPKSKTNKKTLVLDLDETLVHSSMDQDADCSFVFEMSHNMMSHTVAVSLRPHMMNFLEKCAQRFEIIVFTASLRQYADRLLDHLDPERRLISHRLFREHCLVVGENFIKDLSLLNRDLAGTCIVDNSPQAFCYHISNGIPIESWFDDTDDCELVTLWGFLETLADADDVRPLIAKKFRLQEFVDAAVAADDADTTAAPK